MKNTIQHFIKKQASKYVIQIVTDDNCPEYYGFKNDKHDFNTELALMYDTFQEAADVADGIPRKQINSKGDFHYIDLEIVQLVMWNNTYIGPPDKGENR